MPPKDKDDKPPDGNNNTPTSNEAYAAAAQAVYDPKRANGEVDSEYKNQSNKLATDTGGTYILYPQKYYPSGTYTVIESLSADSASKQNSVLKVYLPLPNNLSVSANFAWSTDSLPAYIENIITGTSNLVKEANNGSNSWFDTGVSMLKGLGERLSDGSLLENAIKNAKNAAADTGINMAKKALNTALGSTHINGETLTKQLSKAAGLAYNPNKVLYFEGMPNNRFFNMAFEIVPLSSNEAKQAACAVKALFGKSSPDYAVEKAFFTYPSYFKLTVMAHGKVIVEYPSIVIKSIVLTFDSAGGVISTHEDGKPVNFTLNIDGMETVPVTAKDNSNRKYMDV